MNSSGAQHESQAGGCTDPCMHAVEDNWTARLAQARASLQQLLDFSGSRDRFEALLSQVSRRVPTSREDAQPQVVGWVRSRKSGAVSLKLRRAGWRHLCRAIDPGKDALVLTWGATEGDSDSQWIVSICPKRDLPPAAFRRSVILRLRELLVLIPQKEHLYDLNGRVLIVANGELTVE